MYKMSIYICVYIYVRGSKGGIEILMTLIVINALISEGLDLY